jgi:tetratricopeptide (TPR) repeat protein
VAERYRFRHALYQEVAYQRLTAARRVQLHRRIGERKEVGYGPQGRERTAELALHFVRGRDVQRAVRYLWYAGENALQRSAHPEALQHLTQGLALLATPPETPAQMQQELDLQIALGQAWSATKSHGAPEVEQTYARARVLCAQIGETPQIFPALWGLWRFYNARLALLTVRETGEQLVQLAERQADPTHRMVAYAALGQTLLGFGDYAAAWKYLEQGIARIDQTTQRTLVLRHGEAPGVRCLGVAATTLWDLGYPAQAVWRGQEALALAQALAHPYSLRKTIRTSGGQRRIGSRASCCSGWLSRTRLGRKPASSSPWLLPAASRPNRGSCVRRRASCGCGSARASGPRPMSCWRRSTAGSRRALTRPISRRPRRCSRRWGDGSAAGGVIAMRRDTLTMASVVAHYQQALTLAEALGTLPAKIGQAERARSELATAIAVYQSMDMTFWLPQAEATLAHVG